MGSCCSICTLLGRVALALIFLLAGVNKFLDWEGTSQYMASKGFTFIPFFLVAAALVEIASSVLLIIGYRTRIAALVLFLFLIPTTLIFHDFWNIEGLERNMQIILFLKNIAIMGGLLYVMGCGAGCASVDQYCCAKCDIPPRPPV